MKILYTPLMIVPSLDPAQRAAILEAAGPDTTLVETKDAARQRAEIVDTDVLFGRVSNDTFLLNQRLRYYHSIGAGVDAILTRGLHTAIRQPDYALREPIRLEQRELYEATMGIVGFGGTGREVARRALAFGMRVLAVDIEDVPPEPGVEAVWKPDRLYEMLGCSDVVVIALPLTKATRHLFTRDLFRRMRPTGILVNVTRGEIIYGDDLLAALDEGLLWGAGLDVTDPEPLPKGHRLWTHPRV